MSHVQCYFCSRVNASDAMFCDACGGQLNLRPCPNCEAVNEASATLCYACKCDLAQTAAEDSSDANEHVAISAAFDERRPDYARIGLARDEAVPAANAVVTLDEARSARAHRAAPFKRRAILAGAGICVLATAAAIFFASTRTPVRSSSAGPSAMPAQSSAATKASPAPLTSAVEAEAALEATGGSVAACDPGVAALGLCASVAQEAKPAAPNKTSPETARPSTVNEAGPQCTQAAAALALCRQ
jgi:hypothetical protein